MFTRRSFQQALSSIAILTMLFSGSSVLSASAADPIPMFWFWRQPPHPAYYDFSEPWVDVVAWGGTDKKVIYVGAADVTRAGIVSNGLYRSKDQGDTWEYLGKVDDNEYITQLIVHPTKPNIMLAGLNRTVYRGGIYRSADSGETWTSVLPYLSTYDIEIDPSQPNIIYATGYGSGRPPTVNGGVYKSIDEGQTWQYISALLPWIPDIAVHPTSSNILFAANQSGGVYRSKDAGATWKQISQIPADHILINQNNPSQMFIFGQAYQGIWRTEDGGSNWTNTTSNLPHVIADPTIQTAVLDPDDPNTIWVGLKYDGMYVSHDSGDHWEHVSSGLYLVGAGISGPQCESSDIANGYMIIACSGRFYIQMKNVSVAVVDLHVDQEGGYVFWPSGFSLGTSIPDENTGPLRVVSDQNIMATEQVIYKVNGMNTSFSEMMGLPRSQLDTTYWLPWYNNVDLDTQLRFANVTSNQWATVHLYIGGREMTSGCTPSNSPYTLFIGDSLRVSCAGKNNGPVQIKSDVPIVAAERVIYKVNNVNTSFSEMMALPNSQLDTTYWLPWYNNVDLDTQLRFANGSNDTTFATVRVFIGGQEMTSGCLPSNVSYPYLLGPGQSLRLSCPHVNNGPVKIESDQNIIAAERVIYKVNGTNTSYSEMMALPNRQLDTTYWLPWYNNTDLDTQLRFGNVTDQTATVRIYIHGQEMTSGCTPVNSPFSLAPGESLRVSCAGINNGPVKIQSDQNIVAAQRVIYKAAGNIPTSFSETMALPDNQLNTAFWMPWYNNVDLDTQVRFGVP